MPLANPGGFNLIPISVASGKHINMENLQGIAVIIYEDGGATAITIKESIDGASEQALTCVNEIWASSGVTGAFTRETSDADTTTLSNESALTKKDTTQFDQAYFYISKQELSAGFNCIEITVDAGVCIVLGIPVVGRALQNQADIVAA